MKSYLKKESLRNTDEAWIVVDKDDWTADQLGELLQWAEKRKNYGFALSNPNFEYWLLLHFEDGKGMTNSQECVTRLRKYLPNYRKDIDSRKITLEQIAKAVVRTKQRDMHCSNDLQPIWSTSIYKLVEKIINPTFDDINRCR